MSINNKEAMERLNEIIKNKINTLLNSDGDFIIYMSKNKITIYKKEKGQNSNNADDIN